MPTKANGSEMRTKPTLDATPPTIIYFEFHHELWSKHLRRQLLFCSSMQELQLQKQTGQFNKWDRHRKKRVDNNDADIVS